MYGFSVDDDVANPTATGPLRAADGSPTIIPAIFRLASAGPAGFRAPRNNGSRPYRGARSKPRQPSAFSPMGMYAGQSIITFDGSDALKIHNEINNPGDGKSAHISRGRGSPGTTLDPIKVRPRRFVHRTEPGGNFERHPRRSHD